LRDGQSGELSSLWNQPGLGRVSNAPTHYGAARCARGSAQQYRRVTVLAVEDVTADGEANVGICEGNVVQAAPGVLRGALLYLDCQVVQALERKFLLSLRAHVPWLFRSRLILRRCRPKEE
jgi:hypothetical protein